MTAPPLPEGIPLVMCVVCPDCGAKPGHMCREFGRKLVAHTARVGAAQGVFAATAARLRAWLRRRL